MASWCLCRFATSCVISIRCPPFYLFSSSLSSSSLPFPSSFSSPPTISVKYKAQSASSSSSLATGTFTWDDVFGISQSAEDTSSSYLQGYFHKVQLCNRGSGKQSEFLPFVVEGHTVGFIHNGFVEHLRGFSDAFIFPKDNKSNGAPFGEYVSLHPMLKTAEERTSAVAYVVESLGEERIPGIRNELYPVSPSFGAPIFFSLERAAAPYFGIKIRLMEST